MSGRKPGLPQTFDMPVSGEDLKDLPPANVGDFLDEDDTVPRVLQARDLGSTGDSRTTSNVVSIDKSYVENATKQTEPRTGKTEATGQDLPALGAATPLAPSRAKTGERPRRRQINMTADAMKMVEELLTTVQRYSNEQNPSASELFQALVWAAYDAKENLKLSNVPPRGPWGSMSATIFVSSLKLAIEGAIAEHRAHRE